VFELSQSLLKASKKFSHYSKLSTKKHLAIDPSEKNPQHQNICD
jgi:hypothetical protein